MSVSGGTVRRVKRLAWTVAALIVGGYAGYIVGVVALKITGASLTDQHLSQVGGACGFVGAVWLAVFVWRWRTRKAQAPTRGST